MGKTNILLAILEILNFLKEGYADLYDLADYVSLNEEMTGRLLGFLEDMGMIKRNELDQTLHIENKGELFLEKIRVLINLI